jgi:hypothetical protein
LVSQQCIRLHKVCEYPRLEGGDPAAPNSQLHQSTSSIFRVQQHNNPARHRLHRSSLSSNGDSLLNFFLDPEVFQPIPRDILKRTQARPGQHELQIHHSDHDAVSKAYLSTIHQWLPIVSAKRLKRDSDPSSCRDEGDCVSLLFLCMKLLSREASKIDVLDNDEYRTAKQMCFEAECDGFVSIRLLQCLILLTVYELGHAIYPAAFLTLGRAARLGIMMGLHDPRGTRLFTGADTWTVCEEQRRTWWAVLILDR